MCKRLAYPFDQGSQSARLQLCLFALVEEVELQPTSRIPSRRRAVRRTFGECHGHSLPRYKTLLPLLIIQMSRDAMRVIFMLYPPLFLLLFCSLYSYPTLGGRN